MCRFVRCTKKSEKYRNTMRQFILPFAIVILAFNLQAQINDHNRSTHEALTFSEAQMQNLLGSTTLFVLRDQDTMKRDEYERVLRKVWTLTELKFITYKELSKYKNSGHSYFMIGGFVVTRTMSSTTSHSPFVYLLLMHGTDIYARIELFSDVVVLEHMTPVPKAKISGIQKIYTKPGRIKNWNPAQLSIYLSLAQKDLKDKTRRGYFEEIDLPYSFHDNAKPVIYAMDYIDEKFKPMSGDESKRHDLKKLFKYCPFEVKFVSPDELLTKLENKEVRYFLDYVKDCTVKNIRIYDLVENEIIYKSYMLGKFNIDDSDIKKIFQ